MKSGIISSQEFSLKSFFIFRVFQRSASIVPKMNISLDSLYRFHRLTQFCCVIPLCIIEMMLSQKHSRKLRTADPNRARTLQSLCEAPRCKCQPISMKVLVTSSVGLLHSARIYKNCSQLADGAVFKKDLSLKNNAIVG